MHPWNDRRLLQLRHGTKGEEVFEKVFRQRLGTNADCAWTICQKFCEHGMFDQFELLNSAIKKGKIEAGLKELNGIWAGIIIEQKIPVRDQMTAAHEELLANSFLIADLQIR